MSYGSIQVDQCFLYGGGREDFDDLFFYCMFFHRIWYDLCSKCLILFWRRSWISTILRLFLLGGGSSLKSLITILILDVVVYYIWRERNARLHGEAPRNNSIVYSDIVNCIVSKVNLLHNMVSLNINILLHIL
jgi:hypothetical protein